MLGFSNQARAPEYHDNCSSAVMVFLSFKAVTLPLLLLPSLAIARSPTQFSNPILPGFHPDPSCIHVPEEETFYCASSSFNAFPGIPIHASQDLQTWRLVGESRFCYSKYPRVECCTESCDIIYGERQYNLAFFPILEN